MTVGQLIKKLKEFDPEIEVGNKVFDCPPTINVKLTTEREYKDGEVVSEKQVVRIY
jgi:hypothetical protein